MHGVATSDLAGAGRVLRMTVLLVRIIFPRMADFLPG